MHSAMAIWVKRQENTHVVPNRKQLEKENLKIYQQICDKEIIAETGAQAERMEAVRPSSSSQS